jgi:hemin uptake protein HemP
MTADARTPRRPPPPRDPPPLATQRRLSSVELMHGDREILIEHAGCEYRLRVTSQNKLILTK